MTTATKECPFELSTFVDTEGDFGFCVERGEYVRVHVPDEEEDDPVLLPSLADGWMAQKDASEELTAEQYVRACAWKGYVDTAEEPLELGDAVEHDVHDMLFSLAAAAKRHMGEEKFHEWIGFETAL